MHVRYAVEGPTDEPLAKRLIGAVGMDPLATFVGGGKPKLDPKLPGYNEAARHSPWLVLRDLDHDDANGCVPGLVRQLLGGLPSSGMCFRVAVREAEAWLLADADGCAHYFGVSRANVPRDVELLSDPKQSLVNLCRRFRKRDIREEMVPRRGSRRSVGESYRVVLREFVEEAWDPQQARLTAPSLDRAMLALERLALTGP